jgi:hypothetical protein
MFLQVPTRKAITNSVVNQINDMIYYSYESGCFGVEQQNSLVEIREK